ncbi:MAG: DUF3667 domain-containing protein [Saprospiraceae bacterium]|nr:DUF3667 domain-containing protein [Saprospiraceae bacterium]
MNDDTSTVDSGEPEETPDDVRANCLNCDRKLPKKAKFCPRCGQRNNEGKVSMRELLQRFWANFSHLDGKFVKICWQLFIPARVTTEYFRGRQKRYPNPVQFFLIVMFFLLVAVNMDSGKIRKPDDDKPIVVRVDSTGPDRNVDVNIKPQMLYPVIEKYVNGKDYRRALESLSPGMNTPAMRLAMDSLLYINNLQWYELGQIWMRDSTNNVKKGMADTIPLTLGYFVLRVSVDDLVKLQPEDIALKYNLHDWKRKYLLIQGIKSFKDPEGLMRHYLGSLTWTLMALLSCMSLVLMGLYYRQKRFFVEHFVFLLHVHSAALLLLALTLMITKLSGSESFLALAILYIFGHLFVAMKRFYGQNAWVTLFKWLIFIIIYLVGFALFFLGGLMVVVLLF